MSNYMTIKKFNIANGEGVRTAIFFTGCDFACKGCFNKELWDPNAGKPFTKETEMEILNSLTNHIDGISILGGEPLSKYNIDTVLDLCKTVKLLYPQKTIWLWSGFVMDNFTEKQRKILDYIDVLVDGPYIEALSEFNMKWRGSSNQRILYKGKDF